MRYGNPSPEAAFDELLSKEPGLEEVILVPLYPHYAMSSYETAVAYAKEIYKKKKYPFKIATVRPFFDEQYYLIAAIQLQLHTKHVTVTRYLPPPKEWWSN
jgi:ferrochelatase